MGGAVVMVPLLLVVPQQVGLAALDMHTIVGITMIQVAVAGMVGVLPHRRLGHVNGAQFGATVSRRLPAAALARLLGALLVAVALKMWWDLLNGR